MISLVFTLVSAILGIAMFGAILLAPGKAEAEASIASRDSAGDGSQVVASAAASPIGQAPMVSSQRRHFDGIVIDEIRAANINASRKAAPKQQVAWQMAAQIPNTQTLSRQM
ncbi:MAG TPA: hypothetical protein VGG27_14125 [Magnetospirillaceae bacterium]|jgi:hypothetical protein